MRMMTGEHPTPEDRQVKACPACGTPVVGLAPGAPCPTCGEAQPVREERRGGRPPIPPPPPSARGTATQAVAVPDSSRPAANLPPGR